MGDVTFLAEPGSFLTLLGPSGSGKTTTLNIIAGFESPTAGEVLLGSDSITLISIYKRNIGKVFQNYALFPHMTVAQNIAYPLQMRRMREPQIDQMVTEALQMVQLVRITLIMMCCRKTLRSSATAQTQKVGQSNWLKW